MFVKTWHVSLCAYCVYKIFMKSKLANQSRDICHFLNTLSPTRFSHQVDDPPSYRTFRRCPQRPPEVRQPRWSALTPNWLATSSQCSYCGFYNVRSFFSTAIVMKFQLVCIQLKPSASCLGQLSPENSWLSKVNDMRSPCSQLLLVSTMSSMAVFFKLLVFGRFCLWLLLYALPMAL